MATISVLQTIHRNSDAFRQNVQIAPIGILMHATGVNNPLLGRYVDPSLHPDISPNPHNNHWNRSAAAMGKSVQVHGWIGLDRHGSVRAAQTLPFNIACWGSGAGRNGNSNFNPIGRLQFEICEDARTNRAYLERCLDVATSWMAMMCRDYGWDPLGNAGNGQPIIIDHAEGHQLGVASNHADVMHWLRLHGYTLQWVRQETARKLAALNDIVFVRDTFGVATKSVNVRERRDTSSPAVGFIRRGEMTEITGRTRGTDPWTRIRINNRQGWIRTKRIQEYFYFGAIIRSARFTSDRAGDNLIRILSTDTNVRIMGQRDTRIRIEHGDRKGWVNDHVLRDRRLAGHLRGNANLRAAPIIDSAAVVARLPRYTNVTKLGRSGDFTLVSVDGQIGWITTSWLRNGRV